VDDAHRRVAARIRELAADRSLALSHLADRAGVGRTHLGYVMSGKRSPTLSWLVKIASALDVDPIELLREPRRVAFRARVRA
jgi:transcriptional regulator with XRE-family HTH domain